MKNETAARYMQNMIEGNPRNEYREAFTTTEFVQVAQKAMAERDALRAEVAELRAALQECITDDGAVCFEHRDYLARRVGVVSDTARAALAKGAA